jgi:hypothetical protein
MCTDEYVNFRGGVGITIELGQKSFDAYQSGVGLYSALAAMRYAQAHAMGGSPSFDVQHEEIFTWRRVVPYESGMALSEGLVNFQVLKSGQVIGSSLDGDLKVPLDGWLLFPKYLRDPLASPPKEIFRIMKRIEYSQLGLEGVIGS